jgi:hypothetical protein
MPHAITRRGRCFWYFTDPGAFSLAMQDMMLEFGDSGFLCYAGNEPEHNQD